MLAAVVHHPKGRHDAMRIEWTPPVRRTAARRDDKADAAQGDKFSASLAGEPAAAPATAAPALNPLDGLLTVQEVPDELAGRRRQVQRGNSMLDRLEDLRLGLLAGSISRERLDELARLAGSARESLNDPGLAQLLDEIDLRVAVELAKLDAAV
jgi:hypothetical protein